jgi:hypothetical protein
MPGGLIATLLWEFASSSGFPWTNELVQMEKFVTFH